MDSNELDRALAKCLEDFHRRRALGETPEADDYRKRLGPAYADFQDVLAAETVLDDAIEPPEAPAFPQTFNGFTLLRELGRGAMGVVYEAVQRDLGRKVAVKVLRTGFQTEPTALERFRREAKACAQVRHDHIVEIYEAGEWDGQAYYSMALLEGRALHDHMKEGDLPEPRALCRALAGVAEALEALHAQGIVHRDVKPSNIMVEPSGRMVLADFGLARTIDSKKLTTTGHAVGTPLYMSPEQALAREEIDGRTDVYGLGATLYECLCGQPVFHADGLADMLRQVLNERPKPLREVDPSLSPDCERMAMMCLERRKEDRYESAAALRDDLLAFAEGREVHGAPVTPVVRAARKVVAAWPAIAAALLAAVGLALWSASRPGTLVVDSVPPADVTVADADAVVGGGPTTFEADLSPGRYEVVVQRDGFEAERQTVELDPGGSVRLRPALIAKGADPETIRLLVAAAAERGIALAELAAPDRSRAGGGPLAAWPAPIMPLLPRGKVLPADLDELRIRADAMADIDGRLEFRRGDEVLHSEPFEPAYEMTATSLPAAVRDALRPGDEITWGYVPSDRSAPVTTTFTLATDAEEEADRALAEAFAMQPPAVLAVLQDRHRMQAGFHLAVVRRARAEEGFAATAGGGEVEARAVVHAVRRLGLAETPYETQALAAWDRARASR